MNHQTNMKKIIFLLCLSSAVAITQAQTQTQTQSPSPQTHPPHQKSTDSLPRPKGPDSTKFFLQPVEVKALRAGEKAPFTKTDITKQEIEKTNLGQDLPFLLAQTPSVVINSDAGNGVGYTAIYIRGTDD